MISFVKVHIQARLARDARFAHKMWSMRIAFIWAIISGCWVAIPAFQEYIRPVPYAFACIGFSMAICVARLTNQKGIPDV